MAITLPEARIQVNLSNVVEAAISSAKTVRASSQAKREAEFQRAIADGMSYEEQIKLRTKQIEDEKASGFTDTDYIAKLEKSVSDTKKLARFSRYRDTYAKSLAELNAGRINEEEYLTTLRSQMVGIDDPDLRLEIQNDITAGEKSLKEYRDTILANQVKKLKYDGTTSALSSAIKLVKDARASALLNENEDEVTAYDETLAALDSQLSTVRIQDSVTDFQVKSATRGTSPIDKLEYLNKELSNADPNKPIKIGDRTYGSAQEFWTLERDGYLAGSSQLFGNFFSELKTFTENTLNANTSKFGYPTAGTLDNITGTFNDLKGRAEMQPFINQFDVTQASVLTGAVDNLAKYITDAAGYDPDLMRSANDQLKTISTKYGVDTTPYQIGLGTRLTGLIQGGLVSEEEAARIAPDITVSLPDMSNKPKPGEKTPVTPTNPAIQTGYVVKSGDNLSRIAANNGMTLGQLLELNPEFKQNPNMIRPGQNIKLKADAPVMEPEEEIETPANKPTPTTKVKEEPTVKNNKNETQPKAPTPAPVTPKPTPIVQQPAPAAPKPQASGYTGTSVVDYLKSVGQDSSYGTRTNLAKQYGIQNYQGSAQQNTELLRKLRGQ